MNYRTKKTLDWLYRFLTSRPAYHAFFWLAMTVALFVLSNGEARFARLNVFNNALLLAFFAAIVYVNVRWLVPSFLAKNRVLFFLFLLAAWVALITPLEMVSLYWAGGFLPDPSAFRSKLVSSQRAFFMMNGLMALLSTVLKIVTDWFRANRERERLRTETMQSELKFLRSQINPHFLFNTLNNLYSLALRKDPRAPETVLKLSEIMRYMLYECNEKRVLLSREIQYIQNYLDLERLRLPKDAEVSFEIEGSPSDCQIAPLLFIPFVENAFKHGLNAHLSSGFCRLRLKIAADWLHFFIENSRPERGPTLEKGRPKSGGIGLGNVKQRLEMLYPGAHVLRFEGGPDRYAVHFFLWFEAERPPSAAFWKAVEAAEKAVGTSEHEAV